MISFERVMGVVSVLARMSMFEADVHPEGVLVAPPAAAEAVGNDLRATMLNLLADEALSVAALREALADRGEERAETTVRHHLDVLREAGLVELSRLEEVGGGMRKYYRATARVLPYEFPDETDDLADAATVTRAGLSALLESLATNHADAVASVAADLDGGPSDPDRRREFVVRELVSRALTDLAHERDDDLLG